MNKTSTSQVVQNFLKSVWMPADPLEIKCVQVRPVELQQKQQLSQVVRPEHLNQKGEQLADVS